MAELGNVGRPTGRRIMATAPRDRTQFGTLTITGTARLNEVAHPARVELFGIRGGFMCSTEAAADGAFVLSGLRAGRYVVIVHGEQKYLPGAFAVDVA